MAWGKMTRGVKVVARKVERKEFGMGKGGIPIFYRDIMEHSQIVLELRKGKKG